MVVTGQWASQHPNEFTCGIVYLYLYSLATPSSEEKEGPICSRFKNRKHTETNTDSKLKRHATKRVAEYMETNKVTSEGKR